ncbi:MAG: NAD(P)/FAD-dependent oxidoreductase [Reichenbachiella sp.]
MKLTDVIIIGGGLAGLVNSILLSRAGLSVRLFEKKSYPFHRVCGEYISNEVKPFLIKNDLFPSEFEPASISKFLLTSTNGRKAELDLELGGFGISRYCFDQFLFKKAQDAGVDIQQNSTVSEIQFLNDHFEISVGQEKFSSKIAISAHGKRSKLDANLHREFMAKKSPYIGVKYHIKTDYSDDTIALHNFNNGYCGISKVENNTFNLCYLSHRSNLRKFQNITDMESNVLAENPFLKTLFQESEFVFDQPLVINEISFEKKNPVENHLLMSGDAAGMITPLCGNGMAMAIHSAKILSELIIQHFSSGLVNRKQLEKEYEAQWNQNFSFRLSAGRTIQRLFGSKTTSNIGVNLAKIKPVAKRIVALTHGKEF